MLTRLSRNLIKSYRTGLHPLNGLVFNCTKGVVNNSSNFYRRQTTATHIGQPSYQTHPHLVQKDQSISETTLESRRRNLVSKIEENSLVIIFGSNLKYKSSNIFYQFHQNPNMFYLTGFNQPNSIVLLIKDSSLKRGYRMVFFVVESTKDLQLWEGPKCGTEQAKIHFKADEAYDITTFLNRIKPILAEAQSSRSTIYLDIPGKSESQSLETNFTNLVSQMKCSQQIKKLNRFIEPFRLLKDEEELKLIKKSNLATAQAFISNFELTGHYAKQDKVLTEKILMDNFESEVRKFEGDGHAYVPVVAAGKNALALHYVSNDCVAKQGELIMMDAGAYYHGYNTDVTRTWPASGKFTQPQKKLYNLVLSVQKECIKLCHYDNGLSLNEILHKSIDLMYHGLLELGFDVTRNEVINQLYPHHVAHYLGLDVHDTPTVSRNLRLQPGTLVTIEPGVYIPDDARYPEQYRNLGIRIEDNVLITNGEPINLTASIPKEVEDLEFTIDGNRIQKSVPIF